MRWPLLLAATFLTACGPRVVTKETIKTVSVPVVQKCAAAKPEAVTPVNQTLTAEQWESLSHKQRAEIMAAQALARLNYSDALAAATSAC